MNNHQWSDKQYSELTGQPHPDIQEYLQTRDLVKPKQAVAPYTPPEAPIIQPYKSPAHAVFALVLALAPPVVGIVAVGGILWVVVAACAAAVGAVTAFISAYALPIGGGLTALVFLVLTVFGAKAGYGGGSDSGSDAKSCGQNVNININVAGGAVTTNQNKS